LNAIIVTIGDELLQGLTLDTNSSWIGKNLLSYNINVTKTLSIGDTSNQIVFEIKNILQEEFDFLFITGGLGPTHDDITKSAFVRIMNDELVFDENYYLELKQKFSKNSIKMLPMHRTQALLLKKGDIIPNDFGTALGTHYSIDNKHIFIMPGVPTEMKTMVSKYIIPKYIKSDPKNMIITIKTIGITESHLSEKLNFLMKKYSTECKFSFLPSYKGVSFRITQTKDNSNLLMLKDQFINQIQPYAYGLNDDTLELIVSLKLTKLNLTISTAESCTGGLLSKLLTDIPGSSNYFLGGISPYNNKLKEIMLDIPKSSLEKHGAVSNDTALKMAKNIRLKTGSDIGISTTGIAGPGGGNKSKPIGLVYIGLSTKNQDYVKKYNLNFNRNINRIVTTYKALNMIRLLINENNFES
jgi:nicotinamide-nucleotide amidase